MFIYVHFMWCFCFDVFPQVLLSLTCAKGTNTSTFGAKPAGNAGFGTPGGFGAQTPASTGLFGNTNTQTAAGGMFGAAGNTSFGQPQNTSFGKLDSFSCLVSKLFFFSKNHHEFH